ncbi:MAG: hypothetical protein JWP96_1179 [Polaromonas sp.]|nr:hypothetical protein [Polaromonas sp.]
MNSNPLTLSGFRLVRRLALMGAVLGAAALTGCYVVPVNQAYLPVATSTVQVAPPPSSMTFAARLYPSNEAAAAYGMVSGVVTNDLHGRGIFTTQINGESFSGEATRVVGSASREGIANGAGSRGSYINCRYQMNSATLGTGQCKLSNGAQFTMHVGS